MTGSLDTIASTRWDVVILGGGPGGSTAAIRAAREGLRTVVLEKDRHPRFRIGESLLPRNLSLIRELGIEERIRRLPHTVKLGGAFAFGHEQEFRDFRFVNGLTGENHEAFNIERAPFDRALAEAAREAGATVVEGLTVRRIAELRDGAVAVEGRTESGRALRVAGRYLLDASGQATIVGRHLGTRRTLPDLKKVAHYGHFTGVRHPEGERSGYPLIVMCDEGWFWFIPIAPDRTSVGLVLDLEVSKRAGLPASRVLAWALERCPLARSLTAGAVFPETTWTTADFSYRCAPYAGPGYFLVGDAATFVDPVFSTGVGLSMVGGAEAADRVAAILAGRSSPAAARRRYERVVEASSSTFFRLVRGFYDHAFRELFLHGVGPLRVHRALTSILAGHVFPRPRFSVRWRLRLFETLVPLQRRYPLVKRRQGYSLLEARPTGRGASAGRLARLDQHVSEGRPAPGGSRHALDAVDAQESRPLGR